MYLEDLQMLDFQFKIKDDRRCFVSCFIMFIFLFFLVFTCLEKKYANLIKDL